MIKKFIVKNPDGLFIYIYNVYTFNGIFVQGFNSEDAARILLENLVKTDDDILVQDIT